MATDWKAAADKKKTSILNSIQPSWRLKKIPSVDEQKDITGTYLHQFLNAKEVEITETDLEGIARKTTSGAWSAVEVTQAFCHRASLAHQLVNCLHEVFFEAALADATRLDEYFTQNRKPIGPLHGVPVSLKDQFHVKDVDTSMGYVGWIDSFEGKKSDPRKGVYESEMVRELRALGAVLYCKTSVPHTLMSGETVNNIIGYTWNPKNRYLSSGGSSGGEGALIALKGSPGGFGTDIGGSIRIPAGFNGLYGIRPSSGRMPYEGMANSMDGQNSVLSVVGPLAATARSVRHLVKSVLSQSPWLYDPMVIELPWRDAEEQQVLSLIQSCTHDASQLSFAVLKTDGVVSPQPPVARALDLVTSALTRLGHQVIEWQPPSHAEGNALIFKTWLYDGGRDVLSAFALSGEPVATQVSGVYGPDPKEEYTATRIAATNVALRQWRKKYMDYWNSTAKLSRSGRPVDAFIAPLAPYPAARPEMYGYYSYSTFVNGLDYTSVVLPVTTASASLDPKDESYSPMNDADAAAWKSYDAELYDGAHVALQLVGRRLQEEKMLALAEYVGGVVQGKKLATASSDGTTASGREHIVWES